MPRPAAPCGNKEGENTDVDIPLALIAAIVKWSYDMDQARFSGKNKKSPCVRGCL